MFYSFFESGLVLPVLVFAISFVISFLLAPFLRRISLKYGFYAEPNYRSSHIQKVPNSGGILLFFSVAIPICCFIDVHTAHNFLILSISFAGLFIVGVLDDFFNVSVKFKLAGQFLPAALLILSLKTQTLILPFIPASIDFPLIIKISFWLVAVVGIINAYNFIDGIDGLVIGLGILSGLFFGVYFLAGDVPKLGALGFSLSGALLGLLKYNLEKKRKLFIGDTGSLIIGGIISLFVLRLLELNVYEDLSFSSSLAFGMLFIPVSDLVRVVLLRVLNKKSPFSADRSHIHHIIMDRFFISHRRTSVIILALQVVVFLLFLTFNEIFDQGQIIYSLAMFVVYAVAVEAIKSNKAH